MFGLEMLRTSVENRVEHQPNGPLIVIIKVSINLRRRVGMLKITVDLSVYK